MNENERKILETIPLLADYESVTSEVNGKIFLQKVKELHNIEISISRALMVSLKHKQFITIGGGRKTFIVLLERGVRHLNKAVRNDIATTHPTTGFGRYGATDCHEGCSYL